MKLVPFYIFEDRSDEVDPSYTDAVIHMGQLHFPQGIHPRKTGAPETFKGLKRMDGRQSRGGTFQVYSGGSRNTIFGKSKKGERANLYGRALHDKFGHVEPGNDFSPEGEKNADASLHHHMVKTMNADPETAERWRRISDAEVNGQVKYARHWTSQEGRDPDKVVGGDSGGLVFPKDQAGFTRHYMRDPEEAIRTKYH